MDIRADLAAAQARAWALIGQPGTWWTGGERIAIAAETRHSRACALCAARQRVASPAMVGGEHDTLGQLPDAAVEAVHRIATDPGRIGEAWFRRLSPAGLSDERYVELVAVVAVTVTIDTFRAAAGLDRWKLPPAMPGDPVRQRPRKLTEGIAWMKVLLPDDRSPDEPDLYLDSQVPRPRGAGNIYFALSLVPAAMINWWDLDEPMYLTSAQMGEPLAQHRAISNAQIEMLAARVAALNQCTY
jgi:hypothetical protein